MTRKERFEQAQRWFEQTNPNADTELNYTSTWSLLVAVMLSAQCTDKRVNMVTPALMAQFPTPQAMAQATVEQIFHFIRSISYPNAKAIHLQKTAEILTVLHHGEIPRERAALEALPGVGRKTANVILAVAFGQPTMAVDTHVFRVSNRIGLASGKTPEAVEKELMAGFALDIIPRAHHWLILHGRYVCTARAPKCEECGLKEHCKFFATKK